MKPLIFFDTPGQMCNRFWSYIDSVGWAIENRSKVFVLFWDRSIRDFGNLRNNRYIKFPLYSKILINLLGENRYINILKRIFTNKYSRFVYCNFFKNKVTALRSYDLHNNHDYYPKYLNRIKNIFLPVAKITSVVDTTFEKYRRRDFKVVGIHVRRGDYKNWRGGGYFYSYAEYNGFMRAVAKALEAYEIVFFISTNEQNLDWVDKGLPIMNFRGDSAAMDLYALSKCDYIIGPPSSFSRWASLMGYVPIYLIWDKHEIITEKSFSPLKYLDEREDGLRYP